MSAAGRAAAGRLAVRCIVLDGEHVLAPGEIAWDARGRIVRIARARAPEVDLCLLPGLVDAHAHLQLEPLARPRRDFVGWARAVMAAQRSATPAQHRARLRTALAALLADGATAFGEIDSSGVGAGELGRWPVAGRCYRELTGFHLDAAASRRLLRERRPVPRPSFATGWSPHAPYSVSPALFAAARATRRPLAVHCAETAEEQQFLRTGGGPFRDLLASLGRLPQSFAEPGVGAVRWLERLSVLGPRTALVHCQALERGDVARIAAAGASIVVCPGTIEWFDREPPPVPRWLAAGIPVALGTDSRASNHGWSMRRELALAARWWPELRPRDLLAMATRHGARALGGAAFGELRRGHRADFVGVRTDAPVPQLLEEFVHGRLRPALVMAGGVAVAGADLLGRRSPRARTGARR